MVNALASRLDIEVARDRVLWTQSYARGISLGLLRNAGAVQNRRGTTVTFVPDPQIFGEGARFRPDISMARSSAWPVPRHGDPLVLPARVA
ncbi:MAG: hypothetical protein U1E35_06995 [Rhodospirillales bacterium]